MFSTEFSLYVTPGLNDFGSNAFDNQYLFLRFTCFAGRIIDYLESRKVFCFPSLFPTLITFRRRRISRTNVGYMGSPFSFDLMVLRTQPFLLLAVADGCNRNFMVCFRVFVCELLGQSYHFCECST